MAIVYPLTLPPNLVSEVRWFQEQSLYIDESPFTFKRQIQKFSGERFRIEISCDIMERAEAAALSAFKTALRGAIGTFTFGDELYSTPLGAAGGTPRVKGAGQSGYTLITDGWPNNTLVLKAGDFFQITGTYGIHRVLTDATSNGSGEVTLDIWPKAKSYLDNAILITSGWKGLFMLDEPEEVEILSSRADKLETVDIVAVEVVSNG